MDEMITKAAAIYHLQKRLYETADNNLGIMADAGRVFEETASDRIETWIREIPAEKIIRCKDCKDWLTVIDDAESGMCMAHNVLFVTQRNGYCDRGTTEETK